MVESVFKDFYKKIASEAYTGSDLKSVLIKANFLLASSFGEIDSKKELFAFPKDIL